MKIIKSIVILILSIFCQIAVAYKLPYPGGDSWKVTQGPGGNTSHNSGEARYAYDFEMPEGSNVVAIESGKVIKASMSSNMGCAQSSCANYGNRIVIDHGNGYASLYLHLQQYSSSLKEGDIVSKGDIIAKAGKTGWATKAHLHIQLQSICSSWWCQSVALGFEENSGLQLTQGRSYISNNYKTAVTLTDFWKKTDPIYANQTNGFDAQFKLVNNSNSSVTYAKVALSIHDVNRNFIKDMKIFNNVQIAAKGTWPTNLVATNSPSTGNYFVVAKVNKSGNPNDWVNLEFKGFTVIPQNTLTRVSVNCPASSLKFGQTTSCTATSYYSNGTNKSVTTSASWVTNNSNVATVRSGTVTAKATASNTSVSVSASYQEAGITQQGSANLTVTGLDGTLPQDYSCTSDGKVVASKAVTGGQIVLMYSSKCGTNWARAEVTNSNLATYVKVTRTSDARNYSYTGKGTIYTPMVYSPTTKACASGKIGSISVADNTVCR